MNPKVLQQAVRVAVALANPSLEESDWDMLKRRFNLEDNWVLAIKELVKVASTNKDVKLVLNCLSV